MASRSTTSAATPEGSRTRSETETPASTLPTARRGRKRPGGFERDGAFASTGLVPSFRLIVHVIEQALGARQVHRETKLTHCELRHQRRARAHDAAGISACRSARPPVRASW